MHSQAELSALPLLHLAELVSVSPGAEGPGVSDPFTYQMVKHSFLFLRLLQSTFPCSCHVFYAQSVQHRINSIRASKDIWGSANVRTFHRSVGCHAFHALVRLLPCHKLSATGQSELNSCV